MNSTCELCKYKEKSQNGMTRHLRSSCHQRGMQGLYGRLNSITFLDFARAEFTYQQTHCPIKHLQELKQLQMRSVGELQCDRHPLIDTISKEWSHVSSFFQTIMIDVYKRELHRLNLEHITEQIFKYIPECTKPYKRWLTIGSKNFQTYLGIMGNQLKQKNTLSCAV